jgi:hypothetical protein
MKIKIRLIPTCAVLGALLATSTPATAAEGRVAEILHEYTLPPFSLAYFGYTAEELAAAQANGLTTTDHPAIGSGLQRVAGNNYISVTDRGPNADRADGNKSFPLPQFTPTIALFKAVNNQIIPLDLIPIINDLGQGVTGIPNGPADDGTPYLTLTATTPLPFNPDGMDIEDIHTLPGGGYILVEEYGPSVVIVSADGHVLKRYTPVGKTLAGANYSVSDILPPVFKQRRGNRGFESIAVSSDGKTAYTLNQSPMGSTGSTSPFKDSRVVRILRLDITDPLNLQVTGQFVMLTEPLSGFPAGTVPKDMKISAAAWVSQDKLLITEWGDKLGGGKLVLVDLTAATDVTGFSSAATVPLVLENVSTDLGALGITPASTTVVLDVISELPTVTDFKFEGLSILNANEVAISIDNDFGIGQTPNAETRVYNIRLANPLP